MPDPAPPAATPAAIPVTVASTMSAAAVAPVIVWLTAGCPKPMPPDVALSLGAMLIIAAHGTQRLFSAAMARWGTTPATPAVPAPPAAAA